jgi:methylglutaconyl-CoA hydratase
MSSDKLKVEIDGGVARLILAQPEKHNAFDDAIIAAFTDALERVGNDASVRVVVLSGEGKSFSAGADLEWMRRMADYGEAENLADARALAAMLQLAEADNRPGSGRVLRRRCRVGSVLRYRDRVRSRDLLPLRGPFGAYALDH